MRRVEMEGVVTTCKVEMDGVVATRKVEKNGVLPLHFVQCQDDGVRSDGGGGELFAPSSSRSAGSGKDLRANDEKRKEKNGRTKKKRNILFNRGQRRVVFGLAAWNKIA